MGHPQKSPGICPAQRQEGDSWTRETRLGRGRVRPEGLSPSQTFSLLPAACIQRAGIPIFRTCEGPSPHINSIDIFFQI